MGVKLASSTAACQFYAKGCACGSEGFRISLLLA